MFLNIVSNSDLVLQCSNLLDGNAGTCKGPNGFLPLKAILVMLIVFLLRRIYYIVFIRY